MPTNTTKIICIGNALHGDDGLGFEVFKLLQLQSLPPAVEVINGATGGLALIPLFKDCDRVILVDLLDSDKAPGQILEFRNIDIESLDLSEKISLSGTEHGGDLQSLLKFLPLYLSTLPVIDVVGIVGNNTGNFNPGLSQTLINALPTLCDRIVSLAIQAE